ncbi:MAG: PEGA domain-containing protein [Spirochaetales bacterium]|nr:MAG: PEGA domain-containing protein [Spirochaetales bacterium]
MKKVLLFFIFIKCTLSLQAIDLAVTTIEGLGVDQSLSRLVEDTLQSELAAYPLLKLVERGRLTSVLNEQELEVSGITSSQSASVLGSILNVDKIIFGSIARYDSKYVAYVLSLRLVDVKRARIEAAETFEVPTRDDLLDVIAQAAKKLVSKLEIVGEITRIDESGVYISLGEESGLAAGNTLTVFLNEKVINDKGQILFSEESSIANLIIEKVSPEGSLCRITNQNADPDIGMSVRPGTVNISDEEEKNGSIQVESIPTGSTVFLNGDFVGRTPLLIEKLKPGSYKVEIRSGEGYGSYTGRVNLRNGRTVSVERELEPQLEIEDMLAFGRVPRKQTDPWTAVKKSLIPGMGAAYNGYPSSAAPLIMSMSMGALGVFNYYSIGTYSIEDPCVQFYATMVGLGYLGSIANAWFDAKEDFLYPTYFSISTSALYNYLDDDKEINPSYANIAGVGIMPEFTFEGRRFFFVFSLPMPMDPLTVRVIFQQRFFIFNDWSIGGGVYVSQVLNGMSPDRFYSVWTPSLSVSYRTMKVEGDVFFSPIALIEHEIWEPGIYLKADIRYYWSPTSGIKFGTDIWSIDGALGLLVFLGYTMRM